MEPDVSQSQETEGGRWGDTAKVYACGMRWVALIGGLGGSAAILLDNNPYAGLGVVIVLVCTPIAVLLFSLFAVGAHYLFYSIRSNFWRAIASIGFVLGPLVGPFLIFGEFWKWFGIYLPTIIAASVWTALFFLLSAERPDRALVTLNEKRGGFQDL